MEEPELNIIFKTYCKSVDFFPLIGSVLEQKQEGDVFFDQKSGAVLVIHKSRFAQILFCNNTIEEFQFIYNTIINENDYCGHPFDKIRFYNASDGLIEFFTHEQNYFSHQVGERVRFYPKNIYQIVKLKEVIDAKKEVLSSLNKDHDLNVSNRFWKSEIDFLENSLSKCIIEKNVVLSICYSAATSNNKAEIDVSTHINHRNKGLALKVCLSFVKLCNEKNIIPVWDCYANNIGSMKTARSINFQEFRRYNFLILSKK